MITKTRKYELLQQLEQISPRWTAVLRKKGDRDTVKRPTPELNIMDTCRCIVGEAHGFSDCYELKIADDDDGIIANDPADECMDCDHFCTNLIGLTYDATVRNQHGQSRNKLSWMQLEAFIEHFNWEHKK